MGESLVAQDLVLLGFRIATGRRLLSKLTCWARHAFLSWRRVVIRPERFRTGTKVRYGFDSVSNLSAAIRQDVMFHAPLVVINEQTRWSGWFLSLFDLIKLHRSSD